MNTLYLLSDDLRVHDNPALNLAATAERLAVVYCINASQFESDKFGCRGIGEHRWRFLRESLRDLNQSLAMRGQLLHLFEGAPSAIALELLKMQRFDRVVRTRGHDQKTQDWWQELQARASLEQTDVDFIEVDGSTLYTAEQIDIVQDFPDSFSKFRRIFESQRFRPSVDAPTRLPPSIELDSRLVKAPTKSSMIEGGEAAGLKHVDRYFHITAPSTYKATRNALHGNDFSTGLSAYLALGCLSPAQVCLALLDYETRESSNDSTQWILFELLWREFFRWYGRQHKEKLFVFSGIGHKRPLTSFYNERFIKWCRGETPYPLVNACMHELNETGYISNRSRQIVASCLVNELRLDWRCGASYFQQQLIDYDVCSNWGNWQYIAGVGADTKGGRHFNLEKQSELFDADHSYRTRWNGHSVTTPLDSQDYYGWPIAQ